jgi:hypothetical protein
VGHHDDCWSTVILAVESVNVSLKIWDQKKWLTLMVLEIQVRLIWRWVRAMIEANCSLIYWFSVLFFFVFLFSFCFLSYARKEDWLSLRCASSIEAMRWVVSEENEGNWLIIQVEWFEVFMCFSPSSAPFDVLDDSRRTNQSIETAESSIAIE